MKSKRRPLKSTAHTGTTSRPLPPSKLTIGIPPLLNQRGSHNLFHKLDSRQNRQGIFLDPEVFCQFWIRCRNGTQIIFKITASFLWTAFYWLNKDNQNNHYSIYCSCSNIVQKYYLFLQPKFCENNQPSVFNFEENFFYNILFNNNVSNISLTI